MPRPLPSRRDRRAGSVLIVTAIVSIFGLLAMPVPVSAQSDPFTCYRAHTLPGTPKFVSVAGVSLVDRFGAVVGNLLREERYVEQFVTQHSGRGRGPMRIRQDLRQRGIDAEAIETALTAGDVDWTESARAARRRRFGTALPADRRERAKQARFLQYRGFSSDQIRAALGPGEDDQAPD